MQGNKKNKNLIKIAAMTSMTIFSLMAVFTGTMAWFNASRVANSQNDNFVVHSEQGIFNQVTFHSAVNVGASIIQFNQTPFGTVRITDWTTKTVSSSFSDESSFLMDPYDYLEKSHPVLALIKIGSGDAPLTADETTSIKVRASTEVDYYLGDTTEGLKTLYTQAQVSSKVGINPFSSVVAFSYKTFASNSDLSNSEGTFSTTVEGNTVNYDTYDVSGLTSGNNFVNFENDIYDSFNSEIEIYSAPNGTTVKYIGIVFDYYELAVENIYNVFIGDPALDDELYFSCDWSLVI